MRRGNAVLRIPPPLGGTHQRAPFQQQPPNTVNTSSNFWPIDFETNRQALATRPALSGFNGAASPNSDCNMMTLVNGTISSSPVYSMVVCNNSTGALSYWDGSAWQSSTGSAAPTGHTIMPAAYIQEVFIPVHGAKPMVFDLAAGTHATIVESDGTCPSDMKAFIVWQGALWGWGRDAFPQLLYSSRVGDGKDWEASAPASDTGAAYITDNEAEGLLRGNIQAVIPHTDDTMLVCCGHGITAFHGHLRNGGITEDFSDRVVLGPTSWCKGPDDTTYFLTTEGLYALAATPGARPVPLSHEKIPQEFDWAIEDLSDVQVTMVYDPGHECIHIYHRGNNEAWFYDVSSNGFHSVSGANVVRCGLSNPPTTMTNTGNSRMAIGVSVGGVATYNGGGVPIEISGGTASLKIGPIQITNSILDKSLVQMGKMVWTTSGTPQGTFKMLSGKTAEEAVNDADPFEAPFGGGSGVGDIVNRIFYPRVVGNTIVIEISFASSFGISGWSFEGAEFTLKQLGLNR